MIQRRGQPAGASRKTLDSGAQSSDERGGDAQPSVAGRLPVAFLRYPPAGLHRPLTID